MAQQRGHIMKEDNAKPVLPARQVKFDWQDTAPVWVPDDPFTSHFINVLHLLLPEGELWFCRVYNKALPGVETPQLREQVRGFIRQEAIHSRSHSGVLEHFYQAHGVDTEPFTRKVHWLFTQLLGDHPLGIRSEWAWLVRAWLIFRLGVIAAIEHYTCIIGKWILESRGLDEAGADPVMMDLLRWHGAEEVEHRSVAHDLFVSVGGGYLQRQFLMLLVGPILLALWLWGTRYFLNRCSEPGQRFRLLREWRRAAAQDRLPSLGMLVEAASRYLRRDFHPEHEADSHIADDYLAISPAAQAAAIRR
jgi:predicted metal-dependent hydrolase